MNLILIFCFLFNDIPHQTKYVAPYNSEVIEEDLSSVQVPIPSEDRVFNKTGIQCVYSTAETLGRYANEPNLIDLTERSDCKSFSNPSALKDRMNKVNVKIIQTTNKNDKSLIERGCIEERRGVGFDVPGHVLTLIHYDEEGGFVKVIDNSDRKLAVQTWSMSKFNKLWQGWLFIIIPNKDEVYLKYLNGKNILIKNITSNKKYNKDYVPMPISKQKMDK